MAQVAPAAGTAATQDGGPAPSWWRRVPPEVRVGFVVSLACVLVLAVAAIPGVRPRPGVIAVLDDGVQLLGYAGAALVAVPLGFRSTTFRVLWWAVAVAVTLRCLGFAYTILVLDRAAVYPSLADAAWVVSGVLLVVAAVEVARYHVPDHSRTLALDALLGGITAAAVMATALSGTVGRLAAAGIGQDALAVNLTYPVLDVCLLTVIAGLVGLTHGRLSAAVATTSVGVVLLAAVDATFLFQATHGGFGPGSVLTAASLLGTLLVAFGGWLPLERPPLRREVFGGLTTPVLLALVCLGVLTLDAVHPVPPLGIAFGSVGVLVAILRAGITYTGDRRQSVEVIAEKDEQIGRYQALIEASSDYIAIGTLQGKVIYLNPAARRMNGIPAEGPLGDLTIGQMLTDEAARHQREVESPQILATGSWRGESTLRNFTGGPPVPVYKNTFIIRDDAGEAWLLGTIQRDISELHAARTELQRLADERQELLRHLVDAQEAERSRIAADVHDDPVQVMAAVDLQLGLVQRQLDAGADAAATRSLLEQMRVTVSEANDRLRYLLFDLDSPAQREDVETALGEAAAYVLGDAVRWDVRCEDGLDLDETARVLVYRIAKEAMVNVRKHAQATRVRIDVRRLQDGVEVVVADDGVGLPLGDVVPRPGHRGISDMRDRAAIAGGSVTLRNGDERGTVMRLWIPVSANSD
ncbi:hypothetical protein GCM10009623_35310 [Nocardioides aestuarii]